VKKGVRVFTCDHCKIRETWGEGWRYLPGVESEANNDGDGLLYPASFCSDECEDTWLNRKVGELPTYQTAKKSSKRSKV
jgi:hypothetical protein